MLISSDACVCKSGRRCGEFENQKTEAESELSNLQTQFDTLIQKANELELKLIKTGEAIIQAQADLEAAEEKKEEQYEAMKSGLSLCTNPEQAALQSRKL